MNLIKVLRFSLDEMAKRKKRFFFSLILLVFGIVLTGVAMYLYSATSYNAKVCDDALLYGNEGTYYMEESGDLESNGANESFINDIRNINGVCNFGSFYIFEGTSAGGLKQIAQLQRGIPYMGKDDFSTYMINMNSDLMAMCDIKLKDGNVVETPPPNVYYLYLGENLSSIPLETELMASNDSSYKFVVKGYIKSGQVFIDDTIHKVSSVLETYYYDLDKLVIMVGNDDTLSRNSTYFFNIKEGEDKSKVLSDVNAVLKKHGLNYYVDNLEYSFEKRSLEDKNTANMLMQLAVVVIIAVVFIQICMQSSDIISNSRRYGIMYANGFTKADIRKIICVQNLIKLVLALILALMLGYLVIVYNNDGMAPVATYNILFVLRKYVVLKLVLISTVIMAVGTMVPLLVLESMPPVKLMKAK